jgi:hypothetical protein
LEERVTHRAPRGNALLVVLLFLVAAGNGLRLNGQEQDSSISCFYCHMDIIVEMKAGAPKHWNAGVKCEACHGASMGHIDAEDNSVKPEKVWGKSNVHELCRGCHDRAFAAYRKSVHARMLLPQRAARVQANGPSCCSCHGFHGLRSQPQIAKASVSCHRHLPEGCKASVPSDNAHESGKSCKGCHEHHSLTFRRSGL